MKIAVTYDNGSVFQHFGKTENFKIFEVENGAIISSEVVGSNGAGHSALAGFLADAGVDVVICGGIGGGAQEALSEAGIKVCAGVSGDVNEAAESYVNGTLECTSEGNCDHHHEEGGHCCHGEESEESGCEGGCGGCHGGCGTPEPIKKILRQAFQGRDLRQDVPQCMQQHSDTGIPRSGFLWMKPFVDETVQI